MDQIIIIGAGGHGAELYEYIAFINKQEGTAKYYVAGFLDDNPENYRNYQYSSPLLGGVRDHQVRNDVFYLMGIANLEYRQQFCKSFSDHGAKFISLIHPTAYVSPSAKIGEGVVIGPMANIGPNVEIGDFTLINSRCSLGHDTKLGCYNFISPNVSFSGFTRIGDNNLFGINSATIPGIKVGNNNKVMAGMVLDKDIGDNEVVFYRYKEKIIAVPK